MTNIVRHLLRGFQRLVPRARCGFVVIGYHLVGAGTRSPVDVPTDDFEAQLDSLDGRVCSLDDALGRLGSQHDKSDSVAAVLTFDDAYANFYEQVYPRLLERRLPAVLYVPTAFVDRQQPGPIRGTENLPACDWQQLQEMVASGLITLGSHTVTHSNLTQVQLDHAAWELSASRVRIEKMTGQPVRHFCYPRGLWSPELEPLVGQDYATAAIGGGGSIQSPCNPLRLQRTPIRVDSGRDLRPILNHRLWLEERASDLARRIRSRSATVMRFRRRTFPGASQSTATKDSTSRRLLYVVTHGMSARLLLQGQLRWMREQGLEVAVAAAPGADLDAAAAQEGVTVFPIPIKRQIDVAADFRALVTLWRLMRRWRPDIVNASTPKAGLLGMLAARAAAVPVRVYVLRGLRLETAAQRTGAILKATERAAAACAHRVFAVSPSLAARYLDLGLAPPEKVTTLGSGSSNGVDVGRFSDSLRGDANALRGRLDIPATAPVIGFVGRFTRDKGIVELLDAFDRVRSSLPETRLLLVGDFESGDRVPDSTARRIQTDPAIVPTGFVADAAPYYALMDVLAFPSYREGFPNVPLEAAAAGRPVVGFRATGTVDAIVDGVTGALVPLGDVSALSSMLKRYLVDSELRAEHGRAGWERVQREFRPQQIWESLYEEYGRLLGEKGLTLPKQQGLATTELLKRLFDVVCAIVLLILAAPVLLAVGFAIWLTMGSPVLFRQQRPGRHCRLFVLFKFRTMRNAAASQGAPLPDIVRLTPLGSFLRRTSLDELPQLWNVLKGDLSLVGPRPLLPEYLGRYTVEQARRHEVRPGITGWAQVNGRNALSWEDKFALDVWYVDNWSLWLDVKILWMTLIKVLKREGIQAADHATMPEFKGSPKTNP